MLYIEYKIARYLGYFTPSEIYNVYNHTNVNDLKDKSIVIAGLARNAKHRLDYLIPKLLWLCSHFKNYKILFVENDSTDGTREEIYRYNNPNIEVLGCGINKRECSLNLKTFTSENAGSARIGKMAYLRNIYLDRVKSAYRDYDYLFVMDYDIFGSFYVDGIAHTLGILNKNSNVDAIGAYGIDALGQYYDSFALIRRGEDIVFKGYKEKTEHDKDIFTNFRLNPEGGLYRVKSCFAGLVIYKIHKILGKRYNFVNEQIGLACEHSFFNDGLNIFINPRMIMSVLVH